MKTMAIRLDDELHARLVVLAQLQNTSITDIIRRSIDDYIEAKRQDPSLAAQASDVLADIDRAAANRREAIATLFTTPEPGSDTPASSVTSIATAKPKPRGRKPANEAG